MLQKHQKKICLGFILVLLSVGILMINPLITRAIFDHAILKNNTLLLQKLLGIFVLMFILELAIDYIKNYNFNIIGENLIIDFRQLVIQNFQNSNFLIESGEISSRLINEIPSLAHFITITWINVITQILVFITSLALLVKLDLTIGMYCILLIPIYSIVVFAFTPFIRELNFSLIKKQSIILTNINDCINNIGLIRRLMLSKYVSKTLKTSTSSYVKTRMELYNVSCLSGAIQATLKFIPSFIILYFGGIFVMTGKTSIGTLMALLSYSTKLFNPIVSLSTQLLEFQKTKIQFERFFELVMINDERILFNEKVTSLDIKDISFRFNNQDVLFEDMSFIISKGNKVLICGDNGSGKSTLLDIVLGLQFPTKGNVVFNGNHTINVYTARLGKSIGVVPQETMFFTDTILNNILVGREYTLEDVYCLVNELNFNNLFDENLTLDTQLSNNADKLSGGQMKKISILRGLISKPDIIILDEPEVFLDKSSIKSLFEYLNNLSHTIVLLVSHSYIHDPLKIDITIHLRRTNHVQSNS